MLADAAANDDRLADYYERVAKRVLGDSNDGEDTVGAGAVRTVRTSKSKSSAVARINPANATAVVPSSDASTSESETDTADDRSGQQSFIVGDVAFETNPAIEQWMNYYAATPIGRRTMQIGIERSNSYLEMARAEFRKAGIPEDLVWLAFVESVWNPRAVSPAAAGGIWQFIPATATDYGLKVESGNDERADPLKQTRVAAAYLRDLYTIFGDWPLAMAAYNSGEPRVMGAIVKNGNANFWELSEKQLLPKETCNYVPKILASIKVASQADDYGLIPQTEGSGS
jgi:membrane-bound lytic murein transglycosylase D